MTILRNRLLAAATLCVLSTLTTAWAVAQPAYEFNLPQQSLADALRAIGRQTTMNILFEPESVENLTAPAVRGLLSPEEAIKRVLVGTKLVVEQTAVNSLLIAPAGARLTSKTAKASTSADITEVEPTAMRLAQSDAAEKSENTDNDTSEVSKEASEDKGKIQEIVVTAQKRTERLLDVPSAVSVISGERLESLHVNSLADMANYVPGMSVQSLGAPGARNIILRGLNTGYGNATTGATVATYIDDLPIGSSTNGGRGAQYGADLQRYDIERIEVLKGPQGTLYGANTIGGLVKYVLRKPNLSQFETRVGTELSHVNDSGGVDWTARAAVNFPIVTNTLGVRLSGFKKHTYGYIDNIGIGVKDANDSTQQGGRATLLWQVTDSLALRATILGEDNEAGSVAAVTMNGTTQDPLYGSQVVSTRFPTPFQQKTRNYSLGVDWNLGFATLISASGWSKISWNRAEDYSVPYGRYCMPGAASPTNPGCIDYPFANALALFEYGGEVSKFVEELRLTSPDHQRMQWMLGGYYTKENIDGFQSLPTFTPSYVRLPEVNNLLFSNSGGDLAWQEGAAFANLTYSFTDRFDVSGGIRRSAYKKRSRNIISGGVIQGALRTPPDDSLPSVDVTTWMANARFRPRQDMLVYARVATGYRPGYGCKFHSDGTPCGNPVFGTPGIVAPDETVNYETGVKGQFLDRRLQLDASVFYVAWSDVQIQTLSPQGLAYAGNGGEASSRGIELAMSYQMTQSLRFNSTLAYTDAHLDEDAPASGGKAGDQLPIAPRWTGSTTVSYSHSLGERMSLLVGGGYRYRDAIVNQLAHTGRPMPMGPQNIVDLYTGLAMKSLTLQLYGSNVLNNRSYTGLQFINDPTQPKFVPVQPRTIGLNVDYQF